MPPITQNVDQESTQRKNKPLKNKTLDSFRNLFRGKTHSKTNSRAVTPQGSSANLALDEEAEHIGPASQPLPSNSGSVEQTIGATLQDAHHFSISGHARITTIGQQVNNRGISCLDPLEKFISFNALHDSSAQDPERCCHPGTRKSVLDQMRHWADDPTTAERILWLHGPAGVGKSAIAQTIAYSYGRDKVGATFFFFRSDPMRNDGNRIFPTLAWQLAFSVPIVKDLISSALEECPDIPRKTIEAQFDYLIAKPFLSINESSSPSLTRFLIIDGLDECSDVKIQRRILKIIGSTVSDTRFPLRFIISSRSESHIEDFFAQFQYPTLQIDLANIDDAFNDIETYLKFEFARIALEQELDPQAWPGQEIIDRLVSNSSGQFIYASTVIKYVDDEYESAVMQLNVVLGLRPSTGKSPFSELDVLYIEILQRQPDQQFLKDFLPIIVARSTLSWIELENFDEAMLWGLDEKELDRKLRGMHSLLKSKPFLDVHHKSFLDFLDDSSRSGEYHIPKHLANRRYIQLITNEVIIAASRAMEHPDCHGDDHFRPRFVTIIKNLPFPIDLPLDDLEELLRPVEIIQERLLHLPSMSIPWKSRACEQCWTFYMVDNLSLHLAWLRGTTHTQVPKYVGICPRTEMEEKQSIPELELDVCLSSLLVNLRAEEISLNVETIGLVRALVGFDPTQTAMKIRSIRDAQNLVELILCLNKKQCFNSWFGAAAHNATRLAVAIYGRVPVLPQSIFLNPADFDMYHSIYQGRYFNSWRSVGSIGRDCLDSFICGNISHPNVAPFLGILNNQGKVPIQIWPDGGDVLVEKWRESTDPSVSEIQQIIFQVANAIQYIHSLGISFDIDRWNWPFFIDVYSHPKVRFPPCVNYANSCWLKYENYYVTMEDNVLEFGRLFHRVLTNSLSNVTCELHLMESEIPDNVWELIQRCCAKEPGDRPTMDQVVQEMESWISLGQFTSPYRYPERK